MALILFEKELDIYQVFWFAFYENGLFGFEKVLWNDLKFIQKSVWFNGEVVKNN